jgi:hypothetical protein
MCHPALQDRVRLTHAIPTLWLDCGDIGLVRSVWLSSPQYYEVEFRKPGEPCSTRALVRREDLEVVEAAAEVAPIAGVPS